MRLPLIAASLLLLGAGFAQQAQQNNAPRITTTGELPPAMLNSPYNVQFTAAGGSAPLVWSITDGSLPPGLKLDPDTGRLSGLPIQLEASSYRITVTVTDATGLHNSRAFAFTVENSITVRWIQPPALDLDKLSASAEVTNLSLYTVDLTFIAVAVNEINKAFTLGYQHAPLAHTSVRILLSGTLPPGQYYIRVDAVAEYAPRNAIYRAALQTPRSFAIPEHEFSLLLASLRH